MNLLLVASNLGHGSFYTAGHEHHFDSMQKTDGRDQAYQSSNNTIGMLNWGAG